MQIPRIVRLSLFLSVLSVTGCTANEINEYASKIVGNTAGERETKIQMRMSELRGMSPYQVGLKGGREDAFRTVFVIQPSRSANVRKPTESDLNEAEALRRVGEELPLFNGQYNDGFAAGWQYIVEVNNVDSGVRGNIAAYTAMRDLGEGRFFNPGRYGFGDLSIEAYRSGWQNAEQAATPVSRSIFGNDEDLRGGK